MIVATDGVADAHVTWLVRFCVVLSLNVPVAVNCSVVPFAMVGLAGVTAIDCSIAAVTVSDRRAVTPLSVAVIVVVPAATPLASPPGDVIVATDGVRRRPRHLARQVLRRVVAERPRRRELLASVPFAMVGSAGVTAIDCSIAAVTVSVSFGLVTPLSDAVITVVPVAIPEATPRPRRVGDRRHRRSTRPR